MNLSERLARAAELRTDETKIDPTIHLEGPRFTLHLGPLRNDTLRTPQRVVDPAPIDDELIATPAPIDVSVVSPPIVEPLVVAPPVVTEPPRPRPTDTEAVIDLTKRPVAVMRMRLPSTAALPPGPSSPARVATPLTPPPPIVMGPASPAPKLHPAPHEDFALPAPPPPPPPPVILATADEHLPRLTSNESQSLAGGTLPDDVVNPRPSPRPQKAPSPTAPPSPWSRLARIEQAVTNAWDSISDNSRAQMRLRPRAADNDATGDVAVPPCPACGSSAHIDIHDPFRGRLHLSCNSCFKMWQVAIAPSARRADIDMRD